MAVIAAMNSIAPEFIWSNTDFPYMCLKDKYRTENFRKVIKSVVNKNDVVLDVGAGSGIMSLFAARMGAKKVYAVEIDHMLAESLRRTVRANKVENIIEVVEGDIFKVDLPDAIDIVIAEIIDTGMLEELQVPAMNFLRRKKIIDSHTKVIPSRYKTYIQLVNVDNKYYGFEIFAPKHEWPFYKKSSEWIQTNIVPVSDKVEVVQLDFESGNVDEYVSAEFDLNLKGQANAILISGELYLSSKIMIGSTNALNGDKILSIDTIDKPRAKFKVEYQMSKGLGNFSLTELS